MHEETEGSDYFPEDLSEEQSVTVTLESEEYGSEDFTYDTIPEALQGLLNLAGNAASAKDGIARDITIHMPAQTE